MVKLFLTCLLCLLISAPCLSQQPLPNVNLEARPPAEALLNELPDQIRAMDEPVVRIFLRLQLAAYLWTSRDQTRSLNPEIIAAAAFSDLQDHQDEITELYAQSYWRDLLALARLHAPALAERYAAGQVGSRNQIEVAYSMLNRSDGVASALELLRRSLQAGQDPDLTLAFFLRRLKELRPAEVPRLLADILNAAERWPGTTAVRTLALLRSDYLDAQNPPELRARFLAIVVNITMGYATFDQMTASRAHVLLEASLPSLETLLPSRYAEAAALTAAVRQFISQGARESLAARERIRQSADPTDQLLTEARAARNSSTRNMHLAEAAQLALRQGELRRAIDIAADNSPEGNGGLWRDQFLDEVIDNAIRKRDIEIAAYAASKMILPLNRALAKQKIAVHHFGSGDIGRAREVMGEAFKLADSAENDAQKAIALLQLAVGFARIDAARMPEVMQAAIRVINNLPTSEERRGSEARNDHIKRTLMPVVWNIFPVFRALARANADETLQLASSIRRREMRGAATLGAAVAILSQDENAQTTSRSN